MSVKNLTKAEFLKLVGDVDQSPTDWKYKGNRPCIVDFTAPWCSYCKRLDPVLDELADYFKGDIEIYKVDVDQEEELDAIFKIRTIPTLLFCKKDGDREMMLGTMPKHELKDLIERKLVR